ncbi:GD20009 [Drosophila simulans]|uniref:Rho GTPase-activating protein 39 n=1 Tax=Drosophila simulans TaxID=7240 RepID=B4R150_DROSI|nr:GD20009 [Drosophila simulans]
MSSSCERIEWVEIIEPRTKEHMYANLTTGECVWDPPEDVPIKRTDSSQWWELFDTNTQRFYYYNAATQKTVWHRPSKCDIIPLAKLQTLKQNTDPSERREQTTPQKQQQQVQHASQQQQQPSPMSGPNKKGRGQQRISGGNGTVASSEEKLTSSEVISSPRGRQSFRVGTGDSSRSMDMQQQHPQGYASRRSQDSCNQYKESGKSSDSSLSSAHGYRRFNDSGVPVSGHPDNLRLGSLQKQQRGGGKDNGAFEMLQESTSSHNLPHGSTSTSSSYAGGSGYGDKYFDHQLLPNHLQGYSSKSSDIASPTHSIHTPQSQKKKMSPDAAPAAQYNYAQQQHQQRSAQRSGGGAAGTGAPAGKSYGGDREYKVSLARSGSFMSSSINPAAAGHHSKSYRKSSAEAANGGAASDDSMHEKYFKSVENTPLSRRRHTTNATKSGGGASGSNTATSTAGSGSSSHKKHSSDSSPQSPISPQTKSSRQAKTSATSTVPQLQHSPRLQEPSHSLDLLSLERISLGKSGPISPGGGTENLGLLTHSSRGSNDSARQRQKSNNSSANRSQSHHYPGQSSLRHSASSSLDKRGYHVGGGSGDGRGGTGAPKPKPRYQISYYDTVSHSPSAGSGYHGQQLYSNTPPYSGHGHGHHVPPPSLPHQQQLHLEPSDAKQKQSQTLPSPNRQISRLAGAGHQGSGPAASSKEETGHSTVAGQQQATVGTVTPASLSRPGHKMAPPSLKPTIQQIFPPSERAQGMGGMGLGGPTLACMKECDIEKFAADNLNLHSKGIFRKKASVRDMLSWTAEAISRPMLALSRDKADKKTAIELFKLVQIYMADRKARIGMTLNSVAIEIISASLPQQQLRDELYVQLCRQTTENPKRDSLIRGWELMAICLSYVPPSPTFQPTLLNYVNRHRDPTFATSFLEVSKWPIHVQISHYATVCCRRLDRIGSSGRRIAKKPTVDEVEQARQQILRNSMFGNTLSEVMDLQKDKFPFRKLPWIQTTLSEHVLLLNGKQTEGIFRVSADVDEVGCMKNRLDRWDVPDYKNTLVDAHTPASLLKLWYRELYDPLIPDAYYEDCVNTEDPDKAKEIVNKLPEINQLVLTYLIHFLQQFAIPEVVSCTKMDSSNLAMVFAPNCLRCTSEDPKVILENARKEMSFMRTLIQHMDTTHVANLV